MSYLMKQVTAEVEDERRRQNAKWGDVTETDRHMAIGGRADVFRCDLRDEAQALVNEKAESKELTWVDILFEEFTELLAEPDSNWPAQRAEAIQVAAVAVALVEAGDLRANAQKKTQDRAGASQGTG